MEFSCHRTSSRCLPHHHNNPSPQWPLQLTVAACAILVSTSKKKSDVNDREAAAIDCTTSFSERKIEKACKELQIITSRNAARGKEHAFSDIRYTHEQSLITNCIAKLWQSLYHAEGDIPKEAFANEMTLVVGNKHVKGKKRILKVMEAIRDQVFYSEDHKHLVTFPNADCAHLAYKHTLISKNGTKWVKIDSKGTIEFTLNNHQKKMIEKIIWKQSDRTSELEEEELEAFYREKTWSDEKCSSSPTKPNKPTKSERKSKEKKRQQLRRCKRDKKAEMRRFDAENEWEEIVFNKNKKDDKIVDEVICDLVLPTTIQSEEETLESTSLSLSISSDSSDWIPF